MMKNKKDPKWISQADRIYSGFLHLFPSTYRKEYGPWMRQAFRDRCREVARGEHHLFRIFAAEIIPDLLLGAGKEHMTSNFGELNRKHLASLSLLGCMSVWVLFHESVNRQLFDLVDVTVHKATEIKAEYRYKKYQSRIQEMAQWLVEEDSSPKAKALAAYLYLSVDDAKAANLAQQMATEQDVRTLAIAELSCQESAGCNKPDMVARLTEQDPNNAYVWLRALNVAINNEDEISERIALKKMAASSHLESYEAGIEKELISYANQFSPDDTALQEFLDTRVFSSTPSASILNLSKSQCSSVSIETEDLALLNDCRKIASIFAQSDDLMTAGAITKLQYRLSTSQLEQQAAYQGLRDFRWWQAAYYGGASTDSLMSWKKWYADWRGKRESITAIKSVLVSRGMPIHAPSDFEILEYDKTQLGMRNMERR